MAQVEQARATLDDLSREPGKAELIGGRIVQSMASGFLPSRVALKIAMRLHDYAERAGKGYAFGDNMGFAVPELPSGRESFSPDAAYYTGPLPANLMRFVEGPPDFAVEVRSENDFGDAAERARADKREDYFAAGTMVVWDVDPTAQLIRVYRSTAPTQPTDYRPGQLAEAEPVVPGWRVAVADIFG